MSATSANSKQALTLDTAPTLKLASHTIIFQSLPNELHIQGPAPVIFSDDPDRSKFLLTHQTPLLRHQIARLSWHFTTREYISLQTAKTLASTPREGHFSRPLCAAVDRQPSASTSQEFHSTPTPMDPSGGRNKRSEHNFFSCKYSRNVPVIFKSAIRSALCQQLACPSDSPLLFQAEQQLAQSVSSSTWKRYILLGIPLLPFSRRKT